MPDIKYPKNSNSDTVFVEEDGQKTRAVKVVQPDGTIDYPKNANSDSCYVTVDGEKQRALMVADVSGEGTVEYPNNPNSTKGYVTVDGKKHRVILTANIAGGGGGTIESLNVTPSTSAQTITATGGVDGYSPVNVSAVDATIDANIVAGNIKKDVQILGITGSYEGVAPSGTKPITSNGIHDVAGYANADVQVPTTAPDRYTEYSVDVDYERLDRFNTTLPSNMISGDITSITDAVLAFAYYGLGNKLTGVLDFSSVTSYGKGALYHAFEQTNITDAIIGVSSTIYGFHQQTFSSAFVDCQYLETLSFPNLYYHTANGAFTDVVANCSALTTVRFDSLNTTYPNCFVGSFHSISGTHFYFPAIYPDASHLPNYTFYQMFYPYAHNTTTDYWGFYQQASNVTLHFPSNTQSAIAAQTGYPNFSGLNTTILFDLPSSAHLVGADSTTYERNPKYDTATALSWRINGGRVDDYPACYTSGTSDPSVGDTIYSDAACTTPITTIDSIV